MITAKVETIDRQSAEKLLTANHKNRHLSANHVAFFENLLRSHKFITTHQGIAISEKGETLDGQHRLQAIKNTGISASILVVRGVPEVYRNGSTIRTKDCIDFCRARTVSDQLRIEHGIANATSNAAAARAVLIIATGNTMAKLTPTVAVYIIKQYPLITKLAAMRDEASIGILQASVCAAIAIAWKIHPDIMETFVGPLRSGANLKAHSPVLIFRNNFLSGRVYEIGAKWSSPIIMRKLQFAFNALLAHIKEDSVNSLSVTSKAGLNHFTSIENKTLAKIADFAGFTKTKNNPKGTEIK